MWVLWFLQPIRFTAVRGKYECECCVCTTEDVVSLVDAKVLLSRTILVDASRTQLLYGFAQLQTITATTAVVVRLKRCVEGEKKKMSHGLLHYFVDCNGWNRLQRKTQNKKNEKIKDDRDMEKNRKHEEEKSVDKPS